MPTIAIALPNAVTIRDVVHTGTLRELLSIEGARIHIYTQNPDMPEFAALAASGQVELKPLPEPAPGKLEGLLRHIYPLLYYDRFVYLQKVLQDRPSRIVLARALSLVRRTLGNRRAVRWFGKLLLAAVPKDRPPVIEGRPDLVIGTRSLVASLEFPFICEAVERGLPLMTVASSWDNFTTKGFLPFPVEKTVVWNRKMADELVDLFGVDEDEIVVAGYPRQALLRDTGAFTDPARYLEHIGMSGYGRFVLYSASYGELTRTRPDETPREFILLRQVAEQLLPTLPDDTCLVIRLHPYSRDDDERFFDGMERVRVFVPGRSDRYVERVMGESDEQHLAAQIGLAACVVSMASTITIDALSVGKPVLNVAFEPDGTGDAICRFYEYNHFADLLRIAKPPLARSPGDVIAFVERHLGGETAPDIDHAGFEAMYVPANSAAYPRVLRETVEHILAQAR
jgi:hypothetical protein